MHTNDELHVPADVSLGRIDPVIENIAYETTMRIKAYPSVSANMATAIFSVTYIV
jgi:hypothetical protein